VDYKKFQWVGTKVRNKHDQLMEDKSLCVLSID